MKKSDILESSIKVKYFVLCIGATLLFSLISLGISAYLVIQTHQRDEQILQRLRQRVQVDINKAIGVVNEKTAKNLDKLISLTSQTNALKDALAQVMSDVLKINEHQKETKEASQYKPNLDKQGIDVQFLYEVIQNAFESGKDILLVIDQLPLTEDQKEDLLHLIKTIQPKKWSDIQNLFEKLTAHANESPLRNGDHDTWYQKILGGLSGAVKFYKVDQAQKVWSKQISKAIAHRDLDLTVTLIKSLPNKEKWQPFIDAIDHKLQFNKKLLSELERGSDD